MTNENTMLFYGACVHYLILETVMLRISNVLRTFRIRYAHRMRR